MGEFVTYFTLPQVEVAEKSNTVLSEHAMIQQSAVVKPKKELKVLMDYQAPWPRAHRAHETSVNLMFS